MAYGPELAQYKMMIGAEGQKYWYNSGVLLFDCIKWRFNHCEQKILDRLEQKDLKILAPDQDILNLDLKDEIQTLPLKYNFRPQHAVFNDKAFLEVYKKEGYYSEKEIALARETPVVLHLLRFNGQPAWSPNTVHPFKEKYFEVLKKSPWKNTEPFVFHGNLQTFCLSILYKLLPKKIFLKCFYRIRVVLNKKSFERLERSK